MIHKFLFSVLFAVLFTTNLAQAQSYTFAGSGDASSWTPHPGGPNLQTVAFNYLGAPLPSWSWGQNVRFRVTSPELLSGANGHLAFALNYKYNNDLSAGPLYNYAIMVTVGLTCGGGGGVQFEAKWPTTNGDANVLDQTKCVPTAGKSSVLIDFTADSAGMASVQVWDSTNNQLIDTHSYYVGSLFPPGVRIPDFRGYGFAMLPVSEVYVSSPITVDVISRTMLGDREVCSPICR